LKSEAEIDHKSASIIEDYAAIPSILDAAGKEPQEKREEVAGKSSRFFFGGGSSGKAAAGGSTKTSPHYVVYVELQQQQQQQEHEQEQQQQLQEPQHQQLLHRQEQVAVAESASFALDQELCGLNFAYRNHRSKGSVDEPEVRFVAPGTFAGLRTRLVESGLMSANQLKVPRVLKDPALVEVLQRGVVGGGAADSGVLRK
jgi:hypothetical protein